jgi:hypothetical protein
MLTRRAILVGALATGALLRARTSHAIASQPATPVHFDVPAGACDCHTSTVFTGVLEQSFM